MAQHHHVGQTRALSATFRLSLKTSRNGDSTTSLGCLFQCLITPSGKKFFLMSQPKPPLAQLRPYPPVLPLVPREKSPTRTWLRPLWGVVQSHKGP